MRFYPVAAVCAGMLFVSFCSVADAGPVRVAAGGAVTVDPLRLETGHQRELDSFKVSLERQQRIDGGELTPEHAGSFQRRLERINAHYRHELANNNPLAVDAEGHAVNLHQVPRDWTNSHLFRVGAPY